MSKSPGILKKLTLLRQIFRNYQNGFNIIYNVFFKKQGFMIAKMRNGTQFMIRCDSRDFHTINEVFLDNIYGKFIREVKDNKGTVIDIGQNIGCFSIKAARIFKDSQIIAFEPFHESSQIAKINVMMNKLDSRIISYELAISEKKGEVSFHAYPGNHEANSINDIWGWKSNKIAVNSIRLPDFIKDNKIKDIALLKIDCEGSEYEIIDSLSKDDFKKIKGIILEYHKGQSDKLEDTLKRRGFKVYKVKSGKETGIIFARKSLKNNNP
ncbi:FkbM family methyltransferase [Candidatus Pacearchaeota archaeon]|nr:FkbM family methyltransferase [Candidatus Pacearchaeota archaeon]